ncbi:ATP-binding protein [Streptomyces glaucosporus]|uniref:ATP-binding protein n=1 Tax=Streptomyces glaucosporus TaxID=284044 RepID=UPI0031DDCC14
MTSASDPSLASLPGDWPGLPGCGSSSPDPSRVRPRVHGEFAACGFGPAPRWAATAREFTRRTLGAWNLTALVDDVSVIVSELVGNALRYGVHAAPARPAGERPVRLGLLWQDTTLLCAVSDPSSVLPVVREPDHLAESGRGLHIVDALSWRWGWSRPCCGTGKTVWATVGVDGGR